MLDRAIVQLQEDLDIDVRSWCDVPGLLVVLVSFVAGLALVTVVLFVVNK